MSPIRFLPISNRCIFLLFLYRAPPLESKVNYGRWAIARSNFYVIPAIPLPQCINQLYDSSEIYEQLPRETIATVHFNPGWWSRCPVEWWRPLNCWMCHREIKAKKRTKTCEVCSKFIWKPEIRWSVIRFHLLTQLIFSLRFKSVKFYVQHGIEFRRNQISGLKTFFHIIIERFTKNYFST